MRHQISAQHRMGSKEQKASEMLPEKPATLRANRVRKSLDYTKVENPLYVGSPRQTALRSIGDKDGGPGYLQHMEKSENIQGKALNFGVLDWGRLENWKSNEKRIPPRYNMKASLSTKNSTLVETGIAKFSRNRKKFRPPRKDQQASSGERLPPCVRWPRGKPVKLQCSSGQTLDGTQTPCLKNNKFHTVELDDSKGKHADQTTSEKRTSLDWRKLGSCSCPHYTRKHHGSTTSDDCSNHVDEPHHNTVPSSLPLDLPRTSSSHDHFLSSDSRNSHDGHLMEEYESRLSNCFSPEEFHSPISFSSVPHSCPFPLTQEEMVQDLTSSKASKKYDLDIIEPPALKSRYSSPNRRFSFGLGKMTRSFSFKESSSAALPQLSSTYTSVKSAPLISETSLDIDSHKWKKGSVINPSRSSPLRRLLDPLLKLRGGHLSEKVHKDSTSPAHINKKQRQSNNVQALLQLTLKNGIPFFKLVVESSSEILAAAVKKLPSGKDDSSLIYAFYSVHEKKKSGSWIYQSSKEKSYGFGYNIVGQMKICSSYHAEFSGQEKDLYVVRESVLYSTEDGELAAIIVKNPSETTWESKSMVVVIPDGVHSLPKSNSGRPSPLIDRWRSGGVCDCEGWDIGCQFHVLSNQNETVNTPTPSSSPSTSSRVDLCYQGGSKSRSCFSLGSLEDGLYSLEYDPSMSLLQAFSICVAVVSSQKLTHIFQVSYFQGSKQVSSENMEEIPGKYVSKPPVSPAGRV